MPELLQEGLPPRPIRMKYDFSRWADGRAWKFVKGEDYDSSTETFRLQVRKWARANGMEVEMQPYPAVDRDGNPVALARTDAVALGVRFVPREGASS